MAIKANWDSMSLEQRLTAVTLDIMRHPQFALMSGVVCAGKTQVEDTMPTAATDGLDVWYGRNFMMQQSMEQVRWVVLHENFHKALKHCTHATDIVKQYPDESNRAQDYEINLMIFDMDPLETFARRPAGISILFDEKYRGMSWMQILRLLLKEKKEGKSGGNASQGKPFDEHRSGKRSPQEDQAVEKAIDDALRQGKILSTHAGGSGGGAKIDGHAVQRDTDWRAALAQFVTGIIAGEDFSRYNPPNKRMLPLGVIMPSHFSQASGGFIVAGDTSGSMAGVYPVLMGEIARICQTAQPEYVRMLWWDTKVRGEQYFTAANYEGIGKLLKPAGGGGTTPSCVVRYVAEKQYKPKAIIWLTDGVFFSSPADTQVPQLWGVIDNESFKPSKGKVVHINSLYHTKG